MNKHLRITVFTVFLALIGGLIYSCTEDTSLDNMGKPIPGQNEQLEPRYEELTDSLTSLTNKTVLESGCFNYETRGTFWKRFKRWCVVVCADGLAALISNDPDVASDVSLSAARLLAFVPFNPSNPEIMCLDRALDQQLLADTAWARTSLDNSGLIHNKVLVTLYQKYGDDLLMLPLDEIYSDADSIASITPSIGIISPAVRNEAQSIFTQVNEVYNNTDTMEDFFEETKTIYPNERLQLNIFEVVMNGFFQIDLNADNGQYLNAVMQTINSSSLPEGDKQSLRTGISIGHASAFLWSRQFFS